MAGSIRRRRGGRLIDVDQHLSLHAITSELYGLQPGAFVAARDRWVRAAQDAGETQLAATVKALRRPQVAAWLANQLVRVVPDDLAELLSIGERMREAQARLDGDELRDLTRQRRTAVAELMATAKSHASSAGQRVGEAVLRQVEETLNAAVTDENARDELSGGALTSPLKHAGIGQSSPDLTLATQPARSAGQTGGPASGHPAGSGAKSRRTAAASGTNLDERRAWRENVEAARRALTTAKSLHRGATQQARDHQQLLTHAEAQYESAARKAQRLAAELDRAEIERQARADELRAAREKHQAASEWVEESAAELEQARNNLATITDASKRP